MAGDFIKINAGGKKEEGAAISASAGAADANKVIKTTASGTIDETLLPSGIGDDSAIKTSGEAISGPAMCYIDSAGEVKNADASVANAAAAAICFVKDAIADGASGKVYFEGVSSGWSGLTINDTYFLSETAGQITNTAVTTTGSILQPIGKAISATEISFEPAEAVIRG